MAKEDIAKGPVGTKMVEMLGTPSFAKGLTPSILFDLAKDEGIITPEQQADFKSRVGKDKTALQEFNNIVTEAGQPRLSYKTQSPLQISLLTEKGLLPATSLNKTERINLLKTTDKLINEAAEMDATTDVKQKKFLDSMKKAFGDFSKNPVVRMIARRALKILAYIPSGPLDALEFMPKDLMLQLQQDLNMGGMEPESAAMGGMMNINDMITPVGYKEGTKDGTLVGDKEKLFGGKNRARVEKFVNEIIEGEGVTKDLGRGILSAVSIPGIAIKDLIQFLNPVKEAEGSEAFDELISKRQVLISRLNGERLFGGDENEIKSIMDQIKRIDEMMSMLRPKED